MEEWIGRFGITTIECSYKELDRQSKAQFINGLNNSEILAEIIRELTKSDEDMSISSE